MRDLTIIVHEDFTDDVIDSLHERGLIEISDVERDEDLTGFIGEERIPDVIGKCTEYEMKLTSVLDIFERIEEEGNTISEFLNPEPIEKVRKEKKGLNDIFEKIDVLMEKNGNQILEQDDKLSNIEEKIQDLELLKDNLKLLQDMEIDLSDIGVSEYTIFRVGTTSSPLKAKKAISQVDASFYDIQSVDEDNNIVLAGTYIQNRMELEEAFRRGDVRPIDFKGYDTDKPDKVLATIKDRLKTLKKKKGLILKELKDQKEKWEKEFRAVKEQLENNRDKKEVVQNFGKTDETSVIKGWASKDDVKKVKDVVEDSSKGFTSISVEEPDDPDEVPVELGNPGFLKPFEILTNMFAPPRYDEIDPTFIIGPAFVLFFGLMLGDVIYGSLIVVTSLLMWRGIGKVDEGSKRFSQLLFSVGLSTIVFGILQGGYLGPNKEGHPNLMGKFGFSPPALIQTLGGDGPKILLIVSLLIGLAYLNIGILLSFFQHLHRGDQKKVILENLPWWFLQPGGFILLSGKLFGWFKYSGTIYTLAWILSIAGLGLLVYQARGLSFFELTGFLGDFLSFARILALGLATAGIALTVNVLSDMIASASMGMMLIVPLIIAGVSLLSYGFLKQSQKLEGGGVAIAVIGGLGLINPLYPFYILALVVAVGGHLANAVLQSLGAFVHSLRLQYVEFFGQFYQGGGSPFSTFKPKREYTELEEDVIE